MTDTELKLLAVYRSPVVRLDAICEPYLSLTKVSARQRAALNQLPFPTFRVGGGKSPLLVHIADLACALERGRATGREGWERSQLRPKTCPPPANLGGARQ